MATREKTRDELDMQTLRELASLPANKFCFDCGQRGTTYVNVTIGAFVCSACGGLLRGLNPPHRVKSLTVCSFTEVEMDRIKSRGNEYCTHIWLGKLDSNQQASQETLTSPDKRKEFLIQKYDEKLYYVDPREAIKKMKPRAPPAPVTTNSCAVTRSLTQPTTQKTGVISQTFSAGDISNNTVTPNLFENDPFKESVKQTDNVSTIDGASFADFSSAFGNATNDSKANPSSSSSIISQNVHKKQPAPPPPDRYAALADLDSQQHQQTTAIESNGTTPFWVSGVPTVNAVPFTQGTAPNPFGGGAWPISAQPLVTPNPFQAIQPVNNGTSLHHNGTGFWPAPSGVAIAPFADPWGATQVAAASYVPNPFANSTFTPVLPSTLPGPPANANTKNPFL